ncbi:lipoprotein insertase outer membrane protein LolB [Porticoccaceae bacterium]|nr:lipoprotein insertase outer membrane protein LolB [Porticoccaceae bacterium]MDB2344037.1 lipoprotein insertase outer membrane protein LolB [Porticoccaceae bacterium]MDB2633857.1 lipoprotein insertase outer membrane protein LolB [Porticoccaceae bacterium]
MTTHLTRIASPILLLALLSGCSLTSTQPPFSTTSEHRGHKNVSELTNWQLKGKLGFKTSSTGGSANIQWMQLQDDYQITLRGPFSTGLARIIGNQQIAELKTNGKLVRRAPEQLFTELTGLSITVNELQNWLKGVPSGGASEASTIEYNSDGTIAEFTQNHWQISLTNYQQVNAVKLPKKIVGQRDDISFKLIVSQWTAAF